MEKYRVDQFEREKRQENEENEQRMHEKERNGEQVLRRQRSEQPDIDLEYEAQEKAKKFRDRYRASVTKNPDFNKACAESRKVSTIAEKKENRRSEANQRRINIIAPFQTTEPQYLPRLPSSDDSEFQSDDSDIDDTIAAYGGGEKDDSFISLDDFLNKASGDNNDVQKTAGHKGVRM